MKVQPDPCHWLTALILTQFAGDAVFVLFDRSYATPADSEQPTAASSALQRALACAVECAKLEHKEAGACLRLKAAVASGAVFVAEVGKAERWELFVGGAALHDLGRAAHDMPVGGVVVAQSAWPAAKAFALGAALASGDVLVSGLRAVSAAPDAEFALESERIYDQARARSDVGAAVAHYVPLSARLRLSELSASHLSDYRERASWCTD